MKWHPASPNKRSVFLLLSALIALAFGYVLHSAQATLKQTGETSQQFGFYDLLLQKNELYDSRMSTVGNMIVSTISNPAHPEFTLKSNYIQSRQQRGKHYFAYAPVYFNPTQDSRLITGSVDLLVNSEPWMEQIEADGVPLVHMQNGMIFIYALESKQAVADGF